MEEDNIRSTTFLAAYFPCSKLHEAAYLALGLEDRSQSLLLL